MDKETHKGVSELKKTSYRGVFRTIGAGTSIWNWQILVKVLSPTKLTAGKYENFVIVTDEQWQLELPHLISDESSSEFNGKCGTCAAELDVSL